MSLIIFIILILFLYLLFTIYLPVIVAWIAQYKYDILIDIGSISVFSLTLSNIRISIKGFKISIQKLKLKSSLVHSGVCKPLSFCFHDVRIEKDILYEQTTKQHKDQDVQKNFFSKKVFSISQFASVFVYNLDVVILYVNAMGDFLVHTSVQKIQFDLNSIAHNGGSITTDIISCHSKVLKHIPGENENAHPSLADMNISISSEISFFFTPFSIENISLHFIESVVALSENNFSFWKSQKKLAHWNKSVSDSPLFPVMTVPSILPKNISLVLADLAIELQKDHACESICINVKDIQFVGKLKTLYDILKGTYCPDDDYHDLDGVLLRVLTVTMKHMKIYSQKDTLLSCQLFLLRLLSGKKELKCNVELNDFDLLYDHLEVMYFMELLNKSDNIEPPRNLESRSLKFPEPLLLFVTSYTTIAFDLNNLNLGWKLQHGQVLYMGIKHVKLYGNVNCLSLNFNSLWSRLNALPTKNSPMPSYHFWNTLFSIQTLELKWECIKKATLSCSCVDLKLEWNPLLAETLIYIARCLHELKLELCYKSQKVNVGQSYSPVNRVFMKHIKIKECHVFIFGNKTVPVLLKIQSVYIVNPMSDPVVVVKDISSALIPHEGDGIFCLMEKNLPYNLLIQEIVFHNTSENIKMKFGNKLVVTWSPTLHMILLDCMESIKCFLSSIKESSSSEECILTEQEKASDVVIILDGEVNVCVRLSKCHEMNIFCSNFEYRKLPYKDIQWEELIIHMDSHPIFYFFKFHLQCNEQSEIVLAERKSHENLETTENKAWFINGEEIKIKMPHNYNFAETFSEQFLGVVKWLKSVHGKSKQPFTINTPLPPDIFFEVDEFSFEIIDDPFEVKLRNNFSLLVDEYKERVKREKVLHENIRRMKKKMVSEAKIEDLYKSYIRSNSTTYIQRSQVLNSNSIRCLFTWHMSKLEVVILADISYHGKEKVVERMNAIDPLSPVPTNMEFSTLWCRVIRGSCQLLEFKLRDFHQPLLLMRNFYVCGYLIGAETAETKRSLRTTTIEMDAPWTSVFIERNMNPLKFHHDLNIEAKYFSLAYGPCWEPVLAQINLAFENISRPSLDPSLPLPFWDKMRLLYHGRICLVMDEMILRLQASLDPYNETEEMALKWKCLVADWTNGRFLWKGDLEVSVHTASKYDDCKLLQFPDLKLTIELTWTCIGDPRDHFSVTRCAPDKLPEYSSNQQHDSYRAFRSQNLNLHINMETKPSETTPRITFYGSTLRWFESLKFILSGVSRPIRRGPLFNRVRPKKVQLSRHYKWVYVSLSVHKIKINYWMSVAMQKGFELLGGRFFLATQNKLALNPIDDELKHRPKAEWTVRSFNFELNDAEVRLQNRLQEIQAVGEPAWQNRYFLSVTRVSYGREACFAPEDLDKSDYSTHEIPTHRLAVHDLKAAWTIYNRDVVLAIYDGWMKAKVLRQNLAPEALKELDSFKSTSSRGRSTRSEAGSSGSNNSMLSSPPTNTSLFENANTSTPSPLSKFQTGKAGNLLQKLISEVGSSGVAFSEERETETWDKSFEGVKACCEDDIQWVNWQIELINSQVLLRGSETNGYVILSAAKAHLQQRAHDPVWKRQSLVTKSSWVGSLSCMQYYATVMAGKSVPVNDEDIMWLTLDNIEDKKGAEITDIPDLVGSGQSVGGVVSETVGASGAGEEQLQRIVSRCTCEFYYVSYGERSLAVSEMDNLLPPQKNDSWGEAEEPYDSFGLTHGDLDICTNSLQYSTVLDIVNNLLLYVEPRRKEALDRLQKLKFHFQLNTNKDQRQPIYKLQNQSRATLRQLKELEKSMYHLQKALDSDSHQREALSKTQKIRIAEIEECKNRLYALSEELNMMISIYKDNKTAARRLRASNLPSLEVGILRCCDVCFRYAKWRLTELDGQIGIADLTINGFHYQKTTRNDDTVEHLAELGYIEMKNLMPNQAYKQVLVPTEISSSMPIGRQFTLRVFSKEKPPVGGIPVKELFEINVAPITIGLTYTFFRAMFKFCFPGGEEDEESPTDTSESATTQGKKKSQINLRKHKESSFYVNLETKDDVETMKERAQQNKLFIYIKIPEVPVRVSYKGEKNIEDVHDYNIVIPTLEYHNVNWTWLDLLMAIRTEAKRVLVSQVLKQKLQIKPKHSSSADLSQSTHEEEKARLLLGGKITQSQDKILQPKKGFFR